MRASSKRTFTLFSVLAALVALAAALAFALSEQRRAATDAIARQGPALTALLADRLVDLCRLVPRFCDSLEAPSLDFLALPRAAGLAF